MKCEDCGEPNAKFKCEDCGTWYCEMCATNCEGQCDCQTSINIVQVKD